MCSSLLFVRPTARAAPRHRRPRSASCRRASGALRSPGSSRHERRCREASPLQPPARARLAGAQARREHARRAQRRHHAGCGAGAALAPGPVRRPRLPGRWPGCSRRHARCPLRRRSSRLLGEQLAGSLAEVGGDHHHRHVRSGEERRYIARNEPLADDDTQVNATAIRPAEPQRGVCPVLGGPARRQPAAYAFERLPEYCSAKRSVPHAVERRIRRYAEQVFVPRSIPFRVLRNGMVPDVTTKRRACFPLFAGVRGLAASLSTRRTRGVSQPTMANERWARGARAISMVGAVSGIAS